jgi:hypothetical protein
MQIQLYCTADCRAAGRAVSQPCRHYCSIQGLHYCCSRIAHAGTQQARVAAALLHVHVHTCTGHGLTCIEVVQLYARRILLHGTYSCRYSRVRRRMCMRALVHAACTLATLVAIDLAACSAAGVVGAMQRPPGPRAHRCALRIPAQSAGAQPPIRLAARSLCICSQGAPRRSHHHPPSVSLLATATISERWLHYLTTAPRSASTMPPNRWYRPTKPETGVPRSPRRAPHFCGTAARGATWHHTSSCVRCAPRTNEL